MEEIKDESSVMETASEMEDVRYISALCLKIIFDNIGIISQF